MDTGWSSSSDLLSVRRERTSLHTINGARLLREGDKRGTLESGKLADIIVLDRDITDGVTGGNIRDVNVDFVFLGGSSSTRARERLHRLRKLISARRVV